MVGRHCSVWFYPEYRSRLPGHFRAYLYYPQPPSEGDWHPQSVGGRRVSDCQSGHEGVYPFGCAGKYDSLANGLIYCSPGASKLSVSDRNRLPLFHFNRFGYDDYCSADDFVSVY